MNRVKRTFQIKAYEAYFNAPGKEWDFEDDSDNGVTEPHWAIHHNTLEGKMVRRRDGQYLFIPTGLEVRVDKHKYEYANRNATQMVAAQTSGFRYRRQKIPEYDVKSDTFVASKINFEEYPHQILGDVKVQNLYDLAVSQNLLTQPSTLFQGIQKDKLLSYNVSDGGWGSNENNPDSTTTLFYTAFRAKETEILPNGLLPSEQQREYKRLLKETMSKIEKMKDDSIKQAALIELQKAQAEEAYQQKMAELAGPIFEDLAKGAVFNAETVVEEEEIREDRRAEFHRRLESRRAICDYCHAVLGWDPYSEDRHLMNCSAYLEHKRAEEAYNQRRRNFQNRYDRLLSFDIPRSVGAVTDLINTINDLRFQESEAIYSDKDPAIKEGLQNVREKIKSESNYDRKIRAKQIANLRTAATVLEALYRRLDETEQELEQS